MKNLVFALFAFWIIGAHAQKFTSLEEALKQPKSVKELDLSKQSLIVFPQEILLLNKLKTLKLNHNPLRNLPDNICQLKALEYLEIHGTSITELPACLAEMKKLKMIFAITDSELSFPPNLAEKIFRPEKEMMGLKPKPLDTSVPPPPPPTEKRLNEEMEISDAPNLSLPDKEPSPHAFIMVSKEPSPLNMEEVSRLIGYPKEAKKKKIQGQIVIRVLIDKEGNYKRHTVVKKGHPLLQDAVETQIPKLKFTPAIQDGKPIMFWVNIPLNFKL